MLSSLLITFREGLEAVLIIGIVLVYLSRVGQKRHYATVWFAIVWAVIVSALFALLFTRIVGSFDGRAEQLFEGTTMLVAALLLTSMILWALRQRHMARDMEERVAARLAKREELGLFLLVFFSVLREGVETVLFLAASFFAGADILLGAIIGVACAAAAGYAIFVLAKKVNLRKFFTVTSIILIMFSAGLVARSAHEFGEAGVLPESGEAVWDLNPPVLQDGSYPPLHEEGAIGGVLHDTLGYIAAPSLLEVIVYVVYLVIVAIIWRSGKNAIAR